MRDGRIGYMDTPAQGNVRPSGVAWAADNGCFGSGYPGDEAWLAWLASNNPELCLFATAPDVVADADATVARSLPLLPVIRALGYPAAFVAQDGLTPDTCPWDDLDALFLGGSTEWKLGPEARALAITARRSGKHLHMGRVNSLRRWRYAEHIGCHTVDGTFLTFGPDKNLPRLLGWIAATPFAIREEACNNLNPAQTRPKLNVKTAVHRQTQVRVALDPEGES